MSKGDAEARRLRATAYHEAGHAVARFALGRRIDRATIVPDEEDQTLGHVQGRILLRSEKLEAGIGEFDTLRERKAAEDAIVSALAGPIAEAKLTGRRNLLGASGDDRSVDDVAEALHGRGDVASAYIGYLEALARGTVETLWYLVEALAAELLLRETLSGAAVHRLLWEVVRREASVLWPDLFEPGTITVQRDGETSDLTLAPKFGESMPAAGRRQLAWTVGRDLSQS